MEHSPLWVAGFIFVWVLVDSNVRIARALERIAGGYAPRTGRS